MAEGGKSLDKVPSYERQNTDEVEDLPLKIPVASIYDHFQCPICMSRINGCCITTCGHRFCYKCIEEWVNRRHECPVCKGTLKASSLIKDTGYDALLRIIKEERRAAEKEYFQKLVQNVCAEPFNEDESVGVSSPLQIILRKHLKLSLQQHETYHQELIADYKRGLTKISREKEFLAQKVIREFPHDPDHPERLSKLAEVESKWEKKKEILDQELEKLEKVLANTFDRYLTDHLPPPSTIPLSVTLTVPERNFTCDVILKPEDNMETIMNKLKTFMEKENMHIVEFPACEEFEVSIISPFAPIDKDLLAAMATVEGESEPPLKESETMTLVSQVVHPDCRPVLEFRIKTGTELRFRGKIVLDSDVSSLCFAATFVSGQSKTMNYFMCKNCNIKWVCEPCSLACHKDHGVVPFISNHKPTWACCHCPKKNKLVSRSKDSSDNYIQ